MLDIWESRISNSKAIKIGWWLAVTFVVLLIYRRLQIDLAFIIIAFIVCILYLFAFAADNGSEIDPNPIYLILAWILIITIVYICIGSMPYGSLITLVIGLISLIGVVAWMSYSPPTYPGVIMVVLAVILLIISLAISRCYGFYECLVVILILIIVAVLTFYNYIKEALLVIVIAGIIIGFSPNYVEEC